HVVAGGRDEQNPACALRDDRVPQRLGIGTAAPGIVRGDDVDAAILHERYIVETGDRISGRATAGRVQELARQDRDIPVDPGDPDGIVTGRTDRAGNVRAVEVIVHRVPCVGDRIDPVAVVHVAVAVVVEPVI